MEERMFRVETSAESAYMIVDMDDDTQLDEIAIQVVKDDCPDFLLPIQIIEKNGAISLRFKMVTGTALKYNIQRDMNKNEFLEFALKLLTPFVKCRNWFLDYHNLCIDPGYILFDKSTDKYIFVYIPAEQYKNSDDEIIKFFERVLTNIDITDDQKYQIALSRYFRDNQVQLNTLRNMFLNEKNKVSSNAVQPASRETEPIRILKSDEPEKIKESVNRFTANPVADVISDVKSDDNQIQDVNNDGADKRKNGFLGRFRGSKSKKQTQDEFDWGEDGLNNLDSLVDDLYGKKNKKNDKTKKQENDKKTLNAVKVIADETSKKSAPSVQSPQPVIQNEMQQNNVSYSGYDDDVTNVIYDPHEVQRKYLELIDSATAEMPPKTIDLDFAKEYITLGRSSSGNKNNEPDVVFPQRSGVSRQHLRISKQGEKLVVIDLGSTNFTYLDGQKLIPNMEYTLQDGMILTLAERRPIRYRVHC